MIKISKFFINNNNLYNLKNLTKIINYNKPEWYNWKYLKQNGCLMCNINLPIYDKLGIGKATHCKNCYNKSNYTK